MTNNTKLKTKLQTHTMCTKSVSEFPVKAQSKEKNITWWSLRSQTVFWWSQRITNKTSYKQDPRG